MGPAALVLAWSLSLLPLLLERGGSLDLSAADSSPRVALIGLVWIALASRLGWTSPETDYPLCPSWGHRGTSPPAGENIFLTMPIYE